MKAFGFFFCCWGFVGFLVVFGGGAKAGRATDGQLSLKGTGVLLHEGGTKRWSNLEHN